MKTIMRKQDVLDATGLCYTSIYNKMKVNAFPARVRLSARSVGWIRQEVEDWISNLQRVGSPTVQA